MLHPDTARKLLKNMNIASVSRECDLNPETVRAFEGGASMRVDNYMKLVKFFEARYVADEEVHAALFELSLRK